jgi:hypothetical protein
MLPSVRYDLCSLVMGIIVLLGECPRVATEITNILYMPKISIKNLLVVLYVGEVFTITTYRSILQIYFYI